MRVIAQTHLQLLAQLHSQSYADADLGMIGRAYRRAMVAVDGLYRGSGKPFICHLVGTASIAGYCAAPVSVLLVALLHALPQARTRRDSVADDWCRQIECFGEPVLRLILEYDSYAAAEACGTRAPDEPPRAEIEMLLLADELEDLIDLGAWSHAQSDNVLGMRGDTSSRLERAKALAAERMTRALAIGQTWMAEAFEYWTLRNLQSPLPEVARIGALTSGPVAAFRYPDFGG